MCDYLRQHALAIVNALQPLVSETYKTPNIFYEGKPVWEHRFRGHKIVKIREVRDGTVLVRLRPVEGDVRGAT